MSTHPASPIGTAHILLELLLDIAIHILSSGAHTGKAIRVTRRVAVAYGYDADFIVMPQSISLSLSHSGARHERITAVRSVLPLALNFSMNNALSALSWRAADERVSLEELRSLYQEIIVRPPLNFHIKAALISCANLSFCYLFGGDAPSMGLVLVGTFLGFELRHQLGRRRVHPLLALLAASFFASLAAGLAVFCHLGNTPSIALATSVLYLIPGVPLLNSLIDILGGHVLNGLAHFVNSCTQIICIALGLFGTLFLLGFDNL